MLLKQKERYEISYSGQFCHMKGFGENLVETFKNGKTTINVIFIGICPTKDLTDRYIFYSSEFGGYLMYSTRNVHEYLKEVSIYTPEQQNILNALEENIINLKKQFKNERQAKN